MPGMDFIDLISIMGYSTIFTTDLPLLTLYGFDREKPHRNFNCSVNAMRDEWVTYIKHDSGMIQILIRNILSTNEYLHFTEMITDSTDIKPLIF